MLRAYSLAGVERRSLSKSPASPLRSVLRKAKALLRDRQRPNAFACRRENRVANRRQNRRQRWFTESCGRIVGLQEMHFDERMTNGA